MTPSLHITNTSLGGYLRVECAVRKDGTPYLSKQDFRVPVHLGKGHLDQGVLVLNIANPTAGYFDGDRVDIDVSVTKGARLCLSTPAASRVYRSRSGKPAATHQSFTLAEDAMLEWNPEPFIPHAGASYHQLTHINLHPTASLFFLEWQAPGRVAMGESFAYQNLRWELDLRVNDLLAAREKYDLRPENHSLEALRSRFPLSHYISLFTAGCFTKNWPAEALDALHSDTVHLGHGPLEGGVMVIRALCADSVTARNLTAKLRNLLYQSASLIPPSLGRTPS